MSDHRARARRAVERFVARRTPAGFWPINQLWPWATVAGCVLHCSRCGQEGRAPSPRDPGYDAAVEGFLGQHKACPDTADGVSAEVMP